MKTVGGGGAVPASVQKPLISTNTAHVPGCCESEHEVSKVPLKSSACEVSSLLIGHRVLPRQSRERTLSAHAGEGEADFTQKHPHTLRVILNQVPGPTVTPSRSYIESTAV